MPVTFTRAEEQELVSLTQQLSQLLKLPPDKVVEGFKVALMNQAAAFGASHPDPNLEEVRDAARAFAQARNERGKASRRLNTDSPDAAEAREKTLEWINQRRALKSKNRIQGG